MTKIIAVTVLCDERIPMGQQVLWWEKKVVARKPLGDNIDAIEFDAISLNPLDYQRFKETGPKYDA